MRVRARRSRRASRAVLAAAGAVLPAPAAAAAAPLSLVSVGSFAKPTHVTAALGDGPQRAIADGRLRLTPGCGALCDVTSRGRFLIGRQRLGAEPRLVLRQRRDRLDGGASARIALRSSRATRRVVARALRRGRTADARVVLRVGAPGGTSPTRIVRVRVRR